MWEWLPSMHHRSHDQGGLRPGGFASRGLCIKGVCIQGVGVLYPGVSAFRGVGQTPSGYYGIRSTSLWYASYWNAFLFLTIYTDEKF